MNVKELIDLLKKYPEEASIYVDLGDNLNSPWNYSVKKVEILLVEKKVDKNLKRVASKPCEETKNCEIGVILYVKN